MAGSDGFIVQCINTDGIPQIVAHQRHPPGDRIEDKRRVWKIRRAFAGFTIGPNNQSLPGTNARSHREWRELQIAGVVAQIIVISSQADAA